MSIYQNTFSYLISIFHDNIFELKFTHVIQDCVVYFEMWEPVISYIYSFVWCIKLDDSDQILIRYYVNLYHFNKQIEKIMIIVCVLMIITKVLNINCALCISAYESRWQQSWYLINNKQIHIQRFIILSCKLFKLKVKWYKMKKHDW